MHYFAPNADLCGPLKKNPTHIFYMHILCKTLVILRGDSHALKNANAKTRGGLSTRLYELASVSP